MSAERMSFLLEVYAGLKKYRMKTTGSLEFDFTLIKQFGDWLTLDERKLYFRTLQLVKEIDKKWYLEIERYLDEETKKVSRVLPKELCESRELGADMSGM